jgi:glycosyltransferase involved in cell wall biosynthesis
MRGGFARTKMHQQNESMIRVGINAAFLGKSHNGQSTYIRGLLTALDRYASIGNVTYVIYTAEENEMRLGSNFEWRNTPPVLSHDSTGLSNLLRVLWVQLALPILLRKDKIDVLLCPMADSPVLSTRPYVVVVHDLIPLFFPEESRRLALYFRTMVPLILRNAAKIVADSENTKQDLVAAYGTDADDVAVVPLGVDDVYFCQEARTEAPRGCPDRFFLFVGACLPRKNLIDVIRAFSDVNSKLPEKLVMVTSSGDHLNEVNSTLEALNLQHRVVLYSALTEPQVLFLYRRATALVFLSKYEGFGYPAAEALACGTPVIVSSTTSLPEVVGNAGIVVPRGDLQAVSRAMMEVATDEALRKRLQSSGLVRSQAFRWERIAEDLHSLVLRACAKQSQEFSFSTTSQR